MILGTGQYDTKYGVCLSIYPLNGTRTDLGYHLTELEDVKPEHRERVALLVAACPDLYERGGKELTITGVGDVYPGANGPTFYLVGA